MWSAADILWISTVMCFSNNNRFDLVLLPSIFTDFVHLFAFMFEHLYISLTRIIEGVAKSVVHFQGSKWTDERVSAVKYSPAARGQLGCSFYWKLKL
jgi:hypothetical protein